ncbi:hypothetical protein [Hymenobacter sp. B81]|uniref:hypothetical protein n=1 Tax=Hymenobacter sp. B81 TaxID=3344878 RepID=UPI0037DC39BA
MEPHTRRVLSYNLLALLLGAGGLRLLNQGRDAGLGFLIFMALLVLLLLLLNLAGIILVRERKRRLDFVLGLLLVLLVGFGACLGTASTY